MKVHYKSFLLSNALQQKEINFRNIFQNLLLQNLAKEGNLINGTRRLKWIVLQFCFSSVNYFSYNH